MSNVLLPKPMYVDSLTPVEEMRRGRWLILYWTPADSNTVEWCTQWSASSAGAHFRLAVRRRSGQRRPEAPAGLPKHAQGARASRALVGQPGQRRPGRQSGRHHRRPKPRPGSQRGGPVGRADKNAQRSESAGCVLSPRAVG